MCYCGESVGILHVLPVASQVTCLRWAVSHGEPCTHIVVESTNLIITISE